VQLWLQIFFYSAGIFLIFKTLGRIPEIYDNFYYTSIFLTHIALKHNWFPSIYLILYMLSPFLAVMVKKVTKKQLQALLVILLVIFSKIPQMLFPLGIGFDDDGYGIIWMICLFVVAGYIKLYVPINGKWIKKLGWYLFASFLTFISYFVISFIYLRYGKLDNFTDIFYHYNSPTTIVASIALFLVFINLGQKNAGENKKTHKFIEKMILYIASLTFGIYLIHEHILLRGLWITLWKVPEAFEHWYFMIHYLLVIIAVFIICGSIEAIRKFVFSFLYRSRSWLFFQSKMHKFNARMNGEDDLNARNKTKKSLE
jgi:surface polysaccharide O-acyltransferase-like enzyme